MPYLGEERSLFDRHAFGLWWGADCLGMEINVISRLSSILIVDTHAPLQNAALLDRTAGLALALSGLQRRHASIVRIRGRQMGNRCRGRMLAADVCRHVVCFACFGHCIVAAVEVFALLSLVG